MACEFDGGHSFDLLGFCICRAERAKVEDGLQSRTCEIRGDHRLRLGYGSTGEDPSIAQEKCIDCGALLSDLIDHRVSLRCPGKKDVYGCVHMNFVATVNVCRMTDEKDSNVVVGYQAEVSVKCAECGKPFQFLGLPMGMDTQGARVSVDGLQARMALSPQGAMPSPLSRMRFDINKFDG